jgi:anthranilate synthase component I
MKMAFLAQKTNLDNDPLTVFSRLAPHHEYCFLLENPTEPDNLLANSNSYIGVDPTHVFAALGNTFYADHIPTTVVSPFDTLRNKMPNISGLPNDYVGGLVGYFSYEGLQHIEPSLKFDYLRKFYDFEFGEYRDGLIFRGGDSPEYFHYGQNRLSLYENNQPTTTQLRVTYKRSQKDKTSYAQMVTKARNDIQNGRVFQVVLANQYEYSYEGDLLKLYQELKEINPSPFMFFIKCKNTITLGASPELLLRTNTDREVFLETLAGTTSRGHTAKNDDNLSKRLLNNEKEVAEHSMLVDLARNDVGRVCQIGSVQISKLMNIKKLSHVQHISSVISGKLAVGKDAFDAFASGFPAGTLSGAPKIEAIKMITELEGYERGPFGGTVGYFSYNGDAVHAVNIRSVSARGNKLFVSSGSGIVYDSSAEKEYQEITSKKIAMDHAMKPSLTIGEL